MVWLARVARGWPYASVFLADKGLVFKVFIKAEAPPLPDSLMRELGHGLGDAEFQAHCCKALINLACDNAGSVEVGGIEAVVAAMRSAPDSSVMQRGGCLLLRSPFLGLDSGAVADTRGNRAAEAGAIEAAVEAMRLHPQEEVIQKWACSFLATLSTARGNYGSALARTRRILAANPLALLRAARASFPQNRTLSVHGQTLLEVLLQGGGGHYDKSAIGKKVEVYWDGDGEWFAGTVKDYKPETRKHLIKYEDNDTQWLILAQEEQLGQLRWLNGKPPRGGGKAKEEEKKPRAKKSNAYSMGPSWKCEKCGFVNMDMMNHGRRTICFMCETPRPGVSKEDLEKMKPKYKALSSYD